MGAQTWCKTCKHHTHNSGLRWAHTCLPALPLGVAVWLGVAERADLVEPEEAHCSSVLSAPAATFLRWAAMSAWAQVQGRVSKSELSCRGEDAHSSSEASGPAAAVVCNVCWPNVCAWEAHAQIRCYVPRDAQSSWLSGPSVSLLIRHTVLPKLIRYNNYAFGNREMAHGGMACTHAPSGVHHRVYATHATLQGSHHFVHVMHAELQTHP